jgi:hypothetical protein
MFVGGALIGLLFGLVASSIYLTPHLRVRIVKSIMTNRIVVIVYNNDVEIAKEYFDKWEFSSPFI